MPSLRDNFIANVVGKLWSAFMTLALVPAYIRILGMEAYGLIGLFATLQTVLLALDLGFSTSINRKLAGLPADGAGAAGTRDAIRTLEVLYWGAAAVVAILAAAAAGPLASSWFQLRDLPSDTVRRAVSWMGLAAGLQLPFALYSGGLLGLQRHVLLNGILVLTMALRGVGALAVLCLVEPTIEAFLQWQAVSTAIQSVLAGLCLWGCLPRAGARPHVDPASLRDLWRFAAGIFGISVVTLILTQLDKILLSRMLPLGEFGCYVLASLMAGALSLVGQPLFNTAFPSLSRLAADGSVEGIRLLYHRHAQWASVLLVPPAAVLALFAREILYLWTNDPSTTEQTHALVRLLAVGAALNGLMLVPYALQIAHGWTRLTLFANCASIVALVPALIVLTPRWGARGAATVWIALNAGYVILVIQRMHRRLLVGDAWRWYVVDTGLPAATALAAAVAVRLLMPEAPSPPGQLAGISVAGLASLLAAAVAAPEVRRRLVSLLQRKDGRKR